MIYDAIVVGGSYASLSAALQLVRARRRVLVVDAGRPRNRFARTAHGFFGQDGRAPLDIQRDAARQVAAYPTGELVAGEVTAARADERGYAVTVHAMDAARGPQEVTGRRLVLATGVRDELPAIPGVPERWGVTVLHCPYGHGYEVAGRALGVIAAHPRSAHGAALLPDWGPTTYFRVSANGARPAPEVAPCDAPDKRDAAIPWSRGVGQTHPRRPPRLPSRAGRYHDDARASRVRTRRSGLGGVPHAGPGRALHRAPKKRIRAPGSVNSVSITARPRASCRTRAGPPVCHTARSAGRAVT